MMNRWWSLRNFHWKAERNMDSILLAIHVRVLRPLFQSCFRIVENPPTWCWSSTTFGEKIDPLARKKAYRAKKWRTFFSFFLPPHWYAFAPQAVPLKKPHTMTVVQNTTMGMLSTNKSRVHSPTLLRVCSSSLEPPRNVPATFSWAKSDPKPDDRISFSSTRLCAAVPMENILIESTSCTGYKYQSLFSLDLLSCRPKLSRMVVVTAINLPSESLVSKRWIQWIMSRWNQNIWVPINKWACGLDEGLDSFLGCFSINILLMLNCTSRFFSFASSLNIYSGAKPASQTWGLTLLGSSLFFSRFFSSSSSSFSSSSTIPQWVMIIVEWCWRCWPKEWDPEYHLTPMAEVKSGIQSD